ncbi:AIPR family protein [Candidatus Woesearchaeota archaeon]|nr:AIPR family protein [Candidatus Woesearchaeota archaeon]
MSILAMIETRVNEEINNLDENFKNKPEDIKQGTAFMLFSVKNIFKEFDDNEIEDGIVDSQYRDETHDYGLDAVYVTANGANISTVEELAEYNKDTSFIFHLLQFKRGNTLDMNTLLKFKDGIKKAFVDDEIDINQNEYLFEKMHEVKEIRTKIFDQFSTQQIKVKSYLCFSGVKDTVLNDQLLKPHINDIKKLIVDASYNAEDIEIIGAQELIDFERKKQEIITILNYKKSFKYITQTENTKKLNGYVCIIPTEEVGKLVKQWQRQLFERNIRDFYKNNDINNKIFATACSERESNYFWSFNNGLTITCSKIEEMPDDRYRIYGLQIVNGCQTSNTLYQAYANLSRYKELSNKENLTDNEKLELENIKKDKLQDNSTLLVKIIETEDDDLIYKITETTNSQTPVKVFNLKANEDIHKNIEQFFLDYDIYYERRVNYYKNQRKSPLISMKELAQTYASVILLKPSLSRSRPSSMFASDYELIFPDPQVKQINYKLYLIPVLIYFKVKKKTRSILRNKSEKDSYKVALLKYAKFHICCFFMHSILKEKYNEKEIITNYDEIKKIIENDNDFMKYFNNALNTLKEVLQSYAGNKNKDLVFYITKQMDLDNKIGKFIHQKKI